MVNLEPGQIVHVRSRKYLVEETIFPISEGGDTQVVLSCLEDDAQGQQLDVFWEREIDARILGQSSWGMVAKRGFDNSRYFSAYLHTLRWNCVTSTNPKLFQAPYRAGIEVKAYQLEPLRKALLMPRISLFIADDVGLGKTIEAGLILREMLMRQKIRRVVIACPPSVVRQWQEEMESRFGLMFQIVDREFVAAKRRERGYGINPWTTHTRFIISHALLRDEIYAAPLRDWLGTFAAGSMLILDEAHNAAPASSSRYAIDSQLTKSVRELASRFEHKLFLSATPHNGHSNSFAALLEVLDPQRFCRGVPIKSKKLLDAVMVRRLKQDLRDIGDRDFPKREIVPVVIDRLPKDAPELKLAELLQAYRTYREERLKDTPKATQATASLVMTSLQKRLLSSIEAFARTLKVHRAAIEKQAEKQVLVGRFILLQQAPGADDDRAELSEADIEAEEDTQMQSATQLINQGITQQELDLLEEMEHLAQTTRHQPDARIKRLVTWIQDHLCPNLGQPGATWNHRRVLIFTEYVDTKRYLEQQLGAAIAQSDQEHHRIGVFHGDGMGKKAREDIKAAFNADPAHHPLRILIATDAAREGVNLQNHCADLFHFDIPWNPSRMEQRNGRIDRKLQRESVVRCHYFVLPQRLEDRVLDVLVHKTATIQQELGSLSPVVEKNVSKLFEAGIRDQQEQDLTQALQTCGSGR
jgi:SNF2 family DNA or RNA helicase